MAARTGAHLHSFRVHSKILERNVTHLRKEADLSRLCSLFKSDATPQRRFERAADSPLDVIRYERPKEGVDLIADSTGMSRYEPWFNAAA